MHAKRIVGIATAAAVVLTPLIALALANPTPDQHWTAPNSGDVGESVTAVVAASDGSYYVAGDFVDYSTSYGNAVLADATTGLAQSPFPDVDGDVNVVISDGLGGWFIGGDFERVGTLERRALAHIFASGVPDSGFDAAITHGMGAVVIYALALDSPGVLYVGGNISGDAAFSGTPASGLVILNAGNGAPAGGVTQPAFSGGSTAVYALAADATNDIVFAGGEFTTVNATTRNNLAAFDGTTGTLTSFDPNVNNAVQTLALNTNNGYLYAGGIFTNVNQATTNDTRNRVALFDPVGVVDGLFNPNPDGTAVNTLALDSTGGFLYVGGNFGTIGGQARNRLAQLGMGDGLAMMTFNPDLDDYVLKVALNADGSQLYAVGAFTYADPVTARDGIASYDTGDGSVLPFSQSLQEVPVSIALSVDEASVLIGVYNDSDQQYRADDNIFEPPIPQPRILHILADGTVDPGFAQIIEPGRRVSAMTLSPNEQTLYIGGDFTCVGFLLDCIFAPIPPLRNRLAALDADDGTLLPFDPDMDDTVRTLAISSDGGTLYAGGDFNFVNGGTQRRYLASFDTSNEAVTLFDPDMNDEVYALALTADDSILYAGGAFGMAGPQSRNRIAAFQTAAAGTLMGFDPHPDNPVFALALSADESTVYAGGNFEDVNDGTIFRNGAAAFVATTGVATGFDPDVDGVVYALGFGPDGILYMGGNFDGVGGEQHEYIAAVDAETGEPEAGFDANLEGTSDAVYALAHGGTGNGLLVGGKFSQSFQDPDDTELPYVVTVNIAHYDDTATPTPTPTPTPMPGGGGNHGGGGGVFLPGFSPTPTPVPGAPGRGDPVNLTRYGLHEGDVIGAPKAGDPDVYIVNEWGYKRLFLNPVIFSFYGHLSFPSVHDVTPPGRDVFPVSGLFRVCKTGDPQVYAVEVTGEDTGTLHHVQISGEAAVAQDPDFFHKVFCINNNEFNWYPKSPVPYTSLSQIPPYRR